MSPLPQSHAHFQYTANFYQRKMVQPDNRAVPNSSTFDEEKFLQSGKCVGLLRAIFTTIITFDSNPLSEFIAGFDAKVNADNFKAVLKECVTNQQERDDIDALTPSQLAQIRDLIVFLEDNQERISQRLVMYEHYYDDNTDELFHSGGYFPIRYEVDTLTIIVDAGRARLLIDGTFHELLSCEQFLSNRKEIETLKLGDRKGIAGISLKDAVLKDAKIYGTTLNRFDLSNTDLRNIKSRNTTFKEGTFENAILTGGAFSNVTFQDVSLKGASAHQKEIEPSVFLSFLEIENAHFRRVNLKDIYL